MKSRFLLTVFLAGSLLEVQAASVLVTGAISLSGSSSVTYGLLNDLEVHTEPALPTISSAGDKVFDPTFGTQILRVTDGNDGAYGRTLYSTNPSFNVDNTRLVGNVLSGFNKAKFWTFNATAFTATGGTIPNNMPNFEGYALQWSRVDPDIIYGGGGGAKLWSYNVAANTYTTVKDFTAVVTANYQTSQIHVSGDDNIFSMNIVDTNGSPTGYIVYKVSTDTIIANVTAAIDETNLSKNGRYLVVVLANGDDEIYDLNSGTPVQVGTDLTGTDHFTHNDTGSSTLVSDAANTSMGKRSLATPTVITKTLETYFGFTTQSHHVSYYLDNELWMLLCRHNTAGQTVSAPFDNELLLVSTDGSNRVRRIAHHRSVVGDVDSYYDEPHANVSRDGQFVAFTSNWGGNAGHDRQDLYVVKFTPGPSS